jgi:hypothetical protein
MPRGTPIQYSLLANTAKVCAMNGCEKPRFKLAKHCRMHDERRRRWGTPRSRCWRSGDINTYADVAEDFITANAEHPGIAAAVQWLDAVLEDAGKKIGQPLATGPVTKVFGRLNLAGIEGQALLIRCVAVTLHLTELPEREQELEPYVRNLGHHVVRLVVPAIAKGEKQRKYSRAVGSFLYAQLSTLLAQVMLHKRRHEQAKKQFDEAAKEPFVGA